MERESPLIIGARAAASGGLKSLDNSIRGNGFVGFGGFILGGFVMQFDYKRLSRRKSRKLARFKIDGAKGDDIQDRGGNPDEVALRAWFSGSLRPAYQQALDEIEESGKVQTFFTRDAAFEVVVDDLEYEHTNPEQVEWTMNLIEFNEFPPIIAKKNVFNVAADITAGATSLIENLVPVL